MISTPDREKAIALIDETVKSGARLERVCKEMEIDVRTYYRWLRSNKIYGNCADRRPLTVHCPKNKLSDAEIKQALDYMNSPRFSSMSPCEIVPVLADEGTYVCSESTCYRILHAAGEQHHRGYAGTPTHREPPSHQAYGPNQVYMWDITYLKGGIKGQFFYLYMFTDLYSRKIVGWEVWEEENAQHASELIQRICLAEHHLSTDTLVLHSDNGSPMKGATMLATLYKLGITPSNSRPSVSNDNAYSESLFKTLKYRPGFPQSGFASLEEARTWCKAFVDWYNNEHRHSGIKFLTPNQRHNGCGNEILSKRHNVYLAAKAAHQERWNGRNTRNWTLSEVVTLNPRDAIPVKTT